MKFCNMLILNVIFFIASCSESGAPVGCAPEVTFQFFYNGSALKEYTGLLGVDGAGAEFYSVEIYCPSQPSLSNGQWGRCVDGKLFLSEDFAKKIHVEIETKDINFKPFDVIPNYKAIDNCVVSEHNINLELE